MGTSVNIVTYVSTLIDFLSISNFALKLKQIFSLSENKEYIVLVKCSSI